MLGTENAVKTWFSIARHCPERQNSCTGAAPLWLDCRVERRPQMTRRTGIVIRDQWAQKGRQEGARWLYRVWDPMIRRYKSRAFAVGADDVGRRKPGCVLGDSWATKTAARFGLGLDSASTVSLTQAGQLFLGKLEMRDVSEGHIRGVQFVLDAAAKAGIDDLTDSFVSEKTQAWLSRKSANRPGQKQNKEISARTKNFYLATLCAVANHSIRRGFLIKNPFLACDKFKEARVFRKVYTVDELRIIVSDLGREDPLWLFIVLAAFTGLRSETIRKLQWSMVDWKAKRIRVPASITKMESDVNVPIQHELKAILEERPGIGSIPIVPLEIAELTSDRINELTKRYLQRIGIESKGRSVHCFRHSVASLLTATGMGPFSVMDAIGHSSPVTSKHYSRGADEYREQVKDENWEEGQFYFRREPPVKSGEIMQGAIAMQ
jgi:integrase